MGYRVLSTPMCLLKFMDIVEGRTDIFVGARPNYLSKISLN